MSEQKQDNQLEHTYSSYVRIRDVVKRLQVLHVNANNSIKY